MIEKDNRFLWKIVNVSKKKYGSSLGANYCWRGLLRSCGYGPGFLLINFENVFHQ